MTELTPDQRGLVQRLADIADRIAELQHTEAELKAQLRRLTPGSYTFDGRTLLTVSNPARRFQQDLATRLLPAELLAMCTVPKVDGATAKKLLPPALYVSCCSATGDPVVKLA